VFSGDGVKRLRHYLKTNVFAYRATRMYNDNEADEMDDDVTGLMGATGITDVADEEMTDAGAGTPQDA
jgi:hypothetical protein